MSEQPTKITEDVALFLVGRRAAEHAYRKAEAVKAQRALAEAMKRALDDHTAWDVAKAAGLTRSGLYAALRAAERIDRVVLVEPAPIGD